MRGETAGLLAVMALCAVVFFGAFDRMEEEPTPFVREPEFYVGCIDDELVLRSEAGMADWGDGFLILTKTGTDGWKCHGGAPTMQDLVEMPELPACDPANDTLVDMLENGPLPCRSYS